ncbi:MAG: ACT domain-containing protein [Oscillospiraceae bacterium]|nr:ACT domain-containing protein [Oscillospiraceae bacterium]
MNLKILPYELTVCKVNSASCIDLSAEFYFIAKTDEEISLVCKTEDAPEDTAAREDGWRAFRIEGVLDFSLVGILSKLSGILAGKGIGIFAVSTYNTDYILVKAENLAAAADALKDEGYFII